MFRKIRLRLTLINVAVMGVLFVLLITGTYFVMQAEIFNQSEQLMRMIAEDTGSGHLGRPDEHAPHLARYFFVETDKAGKITDFSSDIPLNRSQVLPLVQTTLQRQQAKGEVKWQDDPYAYLRVPLPDGDGFVLVLVSVEREWDVLRFLLIAMGIAGVISLALAFYGSLFLADKALVPIKKSWQRQRNFVADASHELRTPLAVVQTNLDVVLDNPSQSVASQINWLKNIQAETSRMAKLVDDLLFLARADSDQQPLTMGNFVLDQALREALNPFKALADSQGVHFDIDLTEDVVFCGDENRIKQLLIILVDNALKHTPGGGKVGIKLRETGNELLLTVWDTGEGIPQEHLDKIFERFYRIDKARSRDEGGTGLGLSIAQWIVSSHNGNIKVASTPGTGATFTISLPKPKTTTGTL